MRQTLSRFSTSAGLVIAGVFVAMCGTQSSPTSPSATTTVDASTTATPSTAAGAADPAPSGTLPSVYAQFGNGVQVSLDETTVVLRTTSVPDHRSPYFGSGNAMYEAPQAGMIVNPNVIRAQALVFRVPLTPQATTPSDTPLGPIGISVNGVVFFNQYAAGRQPLTNEIQTFDRYNGHPQQMGQYHYHIEPLWLTGNRGRSSFLGVLLDGYPVYGPQELGGEAPSGLDSCNGHTHSTPDFTSGVYHYHVVSAPPYISGCFRGRAGTVG